MEVRTFGYSRFALCVWAVLFVLLVRQVFVFGTHVPFYDDWILIGHVRMGIGWSTEQLWAVHNEHRIPLAKLAWHGTVGVLRDARAGTFLTVILMSASALLCMWTARKVRGSAHFTDAFFPLVLMNGGQSENVLNSFQLAFSSMSAVTLVGLALIATGDERPSPARIVAIGCVALAMPLCGGCGVPHAPVWCAWLLLVFWTARRSRDARERWTGRIGLAFALATALLTTWYFVDYHFNPGFTAPPPGRHVEAAIQFMSRGIGEPALTLRAYGSWVVMALFVWTVVLLWWISRKSDTQWARALGIAVVLVAMLGTAASVAYGRAMDGPLAGLLERYGLISAPLWCAFFLAAALAWPTRLARALAFTLFALGVACAVPNFLYGEREGALREAKAAALEADLAEGLSIDEIAVKRWRDFFYSPELFASALRDLEATGMRPFGAGHPRARPKPPFEALSSEPLKTIATSDVQERELDNKRVLLVRDGALLEFALGTRPVDAYGAFGIHPGAAASGVNVSGRFVVELRRADGSRVTLFEHRIETGGPEKTFAITFDASAAGGTLGLTIEHAGEPRPLWGGYWRDVRVR